MKKIFILALALSFAFAGCVTKTRRDTAKEDAQKAVQRMERAIDEAGL